MSYNKKLTLKSGDKLQHPKKSVNILFLEKIVFFKTPISSFFKGDNQ